MPDINSRPENIRELLEAVEPTSILPPTVLDGTGKDILSSLFQSREKVYFTGDRLPAWWTPERDKWLWQTTLGSDVLSGAIFSTSARLTSIPVNVRPIEPDNRNNRRLANWSDMLLKHAWNEVAFQLAVDWQTQDNGCFVEIIGEGDPSGPIEPVKVPGTNDYVFATGLRVLDAQKCQRTKNTTYPVVYQHVGSDGVEKFYKFHNTRIIFFSQMPNSRRDMLGVGLCGASRCVRSVIHLDDINLLMDEMLGARPASQLIFGKAISAEDIETAFTKADEKMLTQTVMNSMEARRRSSRSVFVSVQGSAEMVRSADILPIDLKKLPDGFSSETEMNLAINVISMGLGFDPREIWPATVRGATRADAEVQHWKSMMKTPGVWTRTWKHQLEQKWCPITCFTEFDQQDDEQDRNRAEIQQIRAETLKVRLESQQVDKRVAWQLMLQDGDITESQLDMLENSEEMAMQRELQQHAVESAAISVEGGRLQNEGQRKVNQSATNGADDASGGEGRS